MFGAVGVDPQLLMIAQPYTEVPDSQHDPVAQEHARPGWRATPDLVAASAKLIGGSQSGNTRTCRSREFKEGDDEGEAKRKDEEYRTARKRHVQTNVSRFQLAFGMPVLFAAFGLLR